MLLWFICKKKKKKRKYFLLLLFSFLFFSFFFWVFSKNGPHFIFFSCHEQCCLFEFPSLVVILKHSFRFINTMLLLIANPLHPFTSSLMSSVLKLIPFTSFIQNAFSSLFFFIVSSTLNTFTHLFRSNIPP